MPSSSVPKVIGRNGDDPQTPTTTTTAPSSTPTSAEEYLAELKRKEELANQEKPPTFGPLTYEPGEAGYYGNDPFAKIKSEVRTWLGDISEELGYPRFVVGETWETDFDAHFMGWADPFIADEADYEVYLGKLETYDPLLRLNMGTNEMDLRTAGAPPIVDGKLNPYTNDGLTQIFNLARGWAAQQYGIDPSKLAPSTRGSGAGSGRTLPTEAEIRNMFDMDQLTEAIQNQARAELVEEYPRARDLAKAYVQAVVDSKAQKEIDFQTFVRGQFKGTARWQQIYRNKPEGMSHQQYLAPYVSAASQVLGAGSEEFSDVVGGGAALGTSGAGFAARLRKTDAVQNTSGFISNLEQRVSGIRNFLRG